MPELPSNILGSFSRTHAQGFIGKRLPVLLAVRIAFSRGSARLRRSERCFLALERKPEC